MDATPAIFGKTNLTYRKKLQAWCDHWQPSERVLRRLDREAFQGMLDYTLEHAITASEQYEPSPDLVAILTICLEQLHRILELRERVGELEV